MKIQSALSKKKYLAALKERMDSHFHFGAERCTGFFLGSLFCVTYHSGWESNRRITNQKNTALGFVRDRGNSTIVHYINLKGPFAPQYFLSIFCIIAVLCLMHVAANGANEYVLSRWLPRIPIFTVIFVAMIAFAEYLTDESHQGAKILKSILLDPSDPFGYLNHINELD